MKKLLLFFAISALPLAFLHSQITITQSDMPLAGDTLRVSYSGDIIDPKVTDSTCTIDGFLWDYSFLTPNAQWVRKFDSPTTFTFPFNAIFNPLNTSYGEAQYTPDSIPFIGLKPDNAYNFYKKSSSKFKQVGAGLTINSIPLPFAYNPHDTIYRFPLSCGNRDTSYAEFGLTIPGIGYYGQKIHRYNFADGRGTLITPFGMFQAVRERSILAIRDTFADTSGTFGFATNRPVQYEYKWLVKTGKVPYLQVNTNNLGIVTQIQYRDSIRDSVTQIGVQELYAANINFSLYPDPASEIVFISYTLERSESVEIELLDVTGRKAYEVTGKKQNAGDHVEIINLREKNLHSGIYFVRMKAGNREGNSKLILR
jgi:hypothetical protein